VEEVGGASKRIALCTEIRFYKKMVMKARRVPIRRPKSSVGLPALLSA